jgi:thymidine phosphorylase
MSKKLAEGLDALVLDVKTGSGAFIPKLSDSMELARALCETGNTFGVATEALVTDMSQPLGKFVGNAVEVYECVKILRGEGDEGMQATLDLSAELTAKMLVQCGVAKSIKEAKIMITTVLASGEALEKMRKNIELQGGDPNVCDKPGSLMTKGIKDVVVKAGISGYVSAIDTLAIGHLISEIGGGRIRAEDKVDHAVGYASFKTIGERVRRGDELGVIYSRKRAQADAISERMRNAYKISEAKPKEIKLIRAAV